MKGHTILQEVIMNLKWLPLIFVPELKGARLCTDSFAYFARLFTKPLFSHASI